MFWETNLENLAKNFFSAALPRSSLLFGILFFLSSCSPVILGDRPSTIRAREAALRDNSVAKNLSWEQISPTNQFPLRSQWVIPSKQRVSMIRVKYFSGPNCAYALTEEATLSKGAPGIRAFTPPSDGIYSFKIHSALDTGELLSSSCSSAIEVDTTPPVLSDATISFGPGGITDPLRLARGAITGTYSSHCILENSLNVGSCTWTNGSLPETFESQSQGSVTLTLFLRDSVGNVSDPVSTNTLNLSPVPPSVPASLTASAGTANVALTWGAATGDGPVTYTISRSTSSGSGFTALATGQIGTTYTDLTALNGTTYYYVVTATNSNGTSSPSNEATARPISSFNISLVSVDNTTGPNALRIAWTAATGASSYTVKYGTSSGSYPVTATTNASLLHGYPITGLTPGTRVYIMVTATNTVGSGAGVNATAEGSGIPMSRPYLTSVSTTTNSANVSWLGGTGSNLISVKHGTSPGSYTNTATNVASPYSINGLTPNTDYYVILTASNASGSLDSPGEINFTTASDDSGSDSESSPAPPQFTGEIFTSLYSRNGDKSSSIQDFHWYVLFRNGLQSGVTPTGANFSNCTGQDCQGNVSFTLTRVADLPSEIKALVNPSASNLKFAKFVLGDRSLFPDSLYKLSVSSIGGMGLIQPTFDPRPFPNKAGDSYKTDPYFERVGYFGGAATGQSAIPSLAFHASTEAMGTDKSPSVYVFGGMTPTGLSDKLYRFSKSTPSTWQEVVPTNAGKPGDPALAPAARMGAYLASSGDFLILYGGTNADKSTSFPDLWKFSLRENTWTELSTNLIRDSGVDFSSTFGTKVESNGQLAILGGQNLTGGSGPGVLMDLSGIARAENASDLAGLIQPVSTNEGDFHMGASTLDPNGNTIIASGFWSSTSPYSQTLAYWNGSSGAVPLEVDAGSPVSNFVSPYGGVLQASGNYMYYFGGSVRPDTQTPELSDVVFTIDVSTGRVSLLRTVSHLAKRMGAISFVNSDGYIITHGGITETNKVFSPSSDIIEFNPALRSLRNVSSGSSICSCTNLTANSNFGNPASDGSITSPYEICSSEQFMSIEDLITTAKLFSSPDPFSGKYLVQCADLDLGTGSFSPIGTEAPFRGHYDGQGYTIQNLTLGTANRPLDSGTGIFGTLASATVENLKISSVYFYGSSSGGLAATSKSSIIRNIEVLDAVILGSITGGGLLGSSKGDEISDIRVSSTTVQGGVVGGVIGGFSGNHLNPVLRTASTSNTIQGNWAGGLVGSMYGEIQDSLVMGGSIQTSVGAVFSASVSRTNYKNFRAAGGLIGLGTDATLTDCAAYPDEISGNGILGLAAGGLNYSSFLMRVLVGATYTTSDSLSPSAGYQEDIGPNGEPRTEAVHAYVWKTGVDTLGRFPVVTSSPNSAPTINGLNFNQITDLDFMSALNPVESAIDSSNWKILSDSNPWLVPKRAPAP